MKIIILGAGAVGSSVAQLLSSEDDDISVVDTDAYRLHELQERLDIKAVHGVASHPAVLREAGAEDADLLVAVTSSDEVNMVACQVAHTLFRVPTKIARVRAPAYQAEPELFDRKAIPIDVLISPEAILTDHIRRLIAFHGALQVLEFAGGRVQLVAVRLTPDTQPIGKTVRAFLQEMPEARVRVVAVYRAGKALLPTPDTVFEEGDEVFILATRRDMLRATAHIRRMEAPVRRVMLAGGGHIGERLAAALEADHQVKLIEADARRVRALSERLARTIVLRGHAADQDLLVEESIDHVDVFCAVTNHDEVNILSAMLAKRLGAARAMCIVNRPAYVDLVERGDIDVVITPHQVTIGALLAHVRRGDVVAVHSLRRGAAEAIEAVAHGDEKTSRVVGRRVEALELPPGTTVGALVRGEEAILPEAGTVVESGDHVILFVTDKTYVEDVERLFQVDVGFI